MAKGRASRKGRSKAQREWASALGRASAAWEYLSDEQRQLWNVAAKAWRMTGQRYFVKVNARRVFDGQAVLTEPPRQRGCELKRVLKRLVITNRRGRVELKVQVSPARGARYTVWGSLPCNLGRSRWVKCPQLGPLPAPKGGWSEITALYFRKHGNYIVEHELPLVGKRIYIRVREERDDGPSLYEEKRAVVPEPAGERR
jgi:hypothetical protein